MSAYPGAWVFAGRAPPPETAARARTYTIYTRMYEVIRARRCIYAACKDDGRSCLGNPPLVAAEPRRSLLVRPPPPPGCLINALLPGNRVDCGGGVRAIGSAAPSNFRCREWRPTKARPWSLLSHTHTHTHYTRTHSLFHPLYRYPSLSFPIPYIAVFLPSPLVGIVLRRAADTTAPIVYRSAFHGSFYHAYINSSL